MYNEYSVDTLLELTKELCIRNILSNKRYLFWGTIWFKFDARFMHEELNFQQLCL